MTESTKTNPCFMCNEPTTEFKEYSRIVNVCPIPLCKRCKDLIK
jgi:hypothetical protein